LGALENLSNIELFIEHIHIGFFLLIFPMIFQMFPVIALFFPIFSNYLEVFWAWICRSGPRTSENPKMHGTNETPKQYFENTHRIRGRRKEGGRGRERQTRCCMRVRVYIQNSKSLQKIQKAFKTQGHQSLQPAEGSVIFRYPSGVCRELME